MALPYYLIAPARSLDILTAPQAHTWLSASPNRSQNTAFLPTPGRKFPVFTGAKYRRPLSQGQATATTASRRESRAASTGKPFPRPGAAAGPALSDPGWHKTRGAGDDVPRAQAVPARAVPTPAASPDSREPHALRPGWGAVEPTLLPRRIGRGRRPGRAQRRRPPGRQHGMRRGAASLPSPFPCVKLRLEEPSSNIGYARRLTRRERYQDRMVLLAFTCPGQLVFYLEYWGYVLSFPPGRTVVLFREPITSLRIPPPINVRGLLPHKGCHDTKVLLAFTCPGQRVFCI